MEGKAIFEALAAIMQGIDAISKNKTNQQQGFKYRGIDDVYNELHPLLKKHGVVSAPCVIDIQREKHTTATGMKAMLIKHCTTAGCMNSV